MPQARKPSGAAKDLRRAVRQAATCQAAAVEEPMTRARRLEGASQRRGRGQCGRKSRLATSPVVPESAPRRLIQGLHGQHRHGA
jgi:hypothetical protein